jgi:acyl-CoA reductase-like NAD-dependent aldehyde dehydrogenase
MDQASVDAIKATIDQIGGDIGTIVDAVDPQFHVAVVIGTAIAERAPELVKDVEDWIEKAKSGQPTSNEENAAIAKKIADLMEPEGPGLA